MCAQWIDKIKHVSSTVILLLLSCWNHIEEKPSEFEASIALEFYDSSKWSGGMLVKTKILSFRYNYKSNEKSCRDHGGHYKEKILQQHHNPIL